MPPGRPQLAAVRGGRRLPPEAWLRLSWRLGGSLGGEMGERSAADEGRPCITMQHACMHARDVMRLFVMGRRMGGVSAAEYRRAPHAPLGAHCARASLILNTMEPWRYSTRGSLAPRHPHPFKSIAFAPSSCSSHRACWRQSCAASSAGFAATASSRTSSAHKSALRSAEAPPWHVLLTLAQLPRGVTIRSLVIYLNSA